MNKAIEDLIEQANKMNYKILAFQENIKETNLPRAKILDVDNNEICYVEYEYEQWNVL